MNKRWLTLQVENEIGVLARISGLFSAKSYNLDSIAVGCTHDDTISQITISLTSDDKTFEQIKKQLNRCVEVIKVTDLTDCLVYMKEVMYIRIDNCIPLEHDQLFHFAQVYRSNIVEYTISAVLMECVHCEETNNRIIDAITHMFPNRIRIVRGGCTAVASIQFNTKL